MNFPFVRALALFASSAAWLAAAGCAPSSTAFCYQVCACKECSEPELDECILSVQQARRSAEAKECGSELDAALSCVSGGLTCTANEPSAEGCDDEADALSLCGVQAPPGLGIDVCSGPYAKINARYETCGILIDPGSGIECDAVTAQALACYLPCIEATSCDGLLGIDQNASMEYFECVDGCPF